VLVSEYTAIRTRCYDLVLFAVEIELRTGSAEWACPGRYCWRMASTIHGVIVRYYLIMSTQCYR